MTTVPESVTSYLAEAGVDSAPIPTIRPRRLRIAGVVRRRRGRIVGIGALSTPASAR